MNLYAESSAVLRWLAKTGDARDIERHLREAQKVVASRLTLVECRRVLRRMAREATLDEVSCMQRLEVIARAAAHWAVMQVTEEVAARAEGAFPLEPVRSLDAIHLATALVLRQALPDLAILSTDDRVRANAKQLGFPVLPASKVKGGSR